MFNVLSKLKLKMQKFILIAQRRHWVLRTVFLLGLIALLYSFIYYWIWIVRYNQLDNVTIANELNEVSSEKSTNDSVSPALEFDTETKVR